MGAPAELGEGMGSLLQFRCCHGFGISKRILRGLHRDLLRWLHAAQLAMQPFRHGDAPHPKRRRSPYPKRSSQVRRSLMVKPGRVLIGFWPFWTAWCLEKTGDDFQKIDVLFLQRNDFKLRAGQSCDEAWYDLTEHGAFDRKCRPRMFSTAQDAKASSAWYRGASIPT